MAKMSAAEKFLVVQETLSQNYLFRRNVLNKKIEFKTLDEASQFRPMNDVAYNSIYINVQTALYEADGIKSIVKDIINSETTEEFDPINSWLDNLPKWDGMDRVTDLIRCIPGVNDKQAEWMHIWLRGVVAQWKGLDTLHGNEIVPVLIGKQGCHKSTYWARLLPQELREYYMDDVHLANQFSKDMALTNNLLVNLDEMDRYTRSQQALIKQSLSKCKVNGRNIFGRTQEDKRRFASFVATTNNTHPLLDATGSRRYICISVPEGEYIDTSRQMDYQQIYSQLQQELADGMSYWFDNQQVDEMQRFNLQFQQNEDYDKMIQCTFRKPLNKDEAEFLSMSEIEGRILSLFPNLKDVPHLSITIGKNMSAMGYERKHTRRGVAYGIVDLSKAS